MRANSSQDPTMRSKEVDSPKKKNSWQANMLSEILVADL
jgi:hypothetical protein